MTKKRTFAVAGMAVLALMVTAALLAVPLAHAAGRVLQAQGSSLHTAARGPFTWSFRLGGPHAQGLELADEDGVLLAGVVKDSAMAQAGLARGDIILEVNGVAIDEEGAWHDALSKAGNKNLTIKFRHGDDVRTATVKPGEDDAVFMGAVPCGGPHMKIMGAAAPADATVLGLQDDGPAKAAGIEEGDRIVAVAGTKVTTPDELVNALGTHKPGEKVAVEVERGEPGKAETKSITVTLGKHPDDDAKAYLGVSVGGSGDVLKMVPGMKGMPGFKGLPGFPGEMPEGAHAVVGEVVADGPADKAGIEEGEVIVAVNDADVKEPADITAAVAKMAPGDTVTLKVAKAGLDLSDTRDVKVVLGKHPDDAAKAYLGVRLGQMMIGTSAVPFEGMPFDFGQGGDTGSEGLRHFFNFELPAPQPAAPDDSAAGSA